jgi:hypothetical protein
MRVVLAPGDKKFRMSKQQPSARCTLNSILNCGPAKSHSMVPDSPSAMAVLVELEEGRHDRLMSRNGRKGGGTNGGKDRLVHRSRGG